MEDAAPCYTVAAIIHNKQKETIVKTIFQIWLAYFRAPQMFHSDCGRDFKNDLFRNINDLFNIETNANPDLHWARGNIELTNCCLKQCVKQQKMQL